MYDAFVSYSRKDEIFARRLERSLEHYRPPRGISTSKRRLNIFRDIQDLVGNDLSDSIKKALRVSKHLIVICSPHSRESAWVGREIDEFMEGNEKEAIIPVLVSGIPNRDVGKEDKQEQAFHESLYTYLADPLAVDFRTPESSSWRAQRERKREAKFQILAQLFNTSKEELLQRQRQRIRRLTYLAVGLFLLLVVAFGWLVTKAERHARISRSAKLVEHAAANLGKDPTLSFRLAEASLSVMPSYFAEKALWDAADYPFYSVTFKGHEAPVTHAAFSPDGDRVVSSSEDSTARIWDSHTGKELFVLIGHTDTVTCVAYSPNGMNIVTTSKDATARLWDSRTGEQLGILEGHGDGVTSAAFGRQGTLIVTVSKDNTARIWDSSSQKELTSTGPFREGVLKGVAFSPKGNWIAIASSEAITVLWNLLSGELLKATHHSSDLWSVAFSTDGDRIVTASFDKKAIVWAADSGEIVRVLQGHREGVTSAAFSPKGDRIVTSSMDGTARVWDSNLGKRGFAQTRGESADLRFLPSLETTSSEVLSVLLGHSGSVTSAVFSPDGKRIVTTSEDRTARVWNAAEELDTIEACTSPIANVSFSPDGKNILIGSINGTVRAWTIDGGEIIYELIGQSSTLSPTFSPEGKRVLTFTEDNTGYLRDISSGEELALLTGHTELVRSAKFAPNGLQVLTASKDGTARIWDCATGRVIHVLAGHIGPVLEAVFSKDGTMIVTASEDGTARIWDCATGQVIHVLTGHKQGVSTAAFAPDGAQVVTGSWDETARLWDCETGRLVCVLEGNIGKIYEAAFSPDGTKIATRSMEAPVHIWDRMTCRIVQTLEGHTNQVLGAAFSPGVGDRFLTTALDGTARLWDTGTGGVLNVMKSRPGNILSASFSPDGERIVTGSWDGTVRIWPGSSRELLKAINTKKIRGPIRGLTENEKEVWLPATWNPLSSVFSGGEISR